MNYPFPPPPPFNTPAFIVHSVLLGVVAFSIVGMWWPQKRQFRTAVAVTSVITLLVVITFVAAAISSGPHEKQPFFLLCMAFVALVAGIGFVCRLQGHRLRKNVTTRWFAGISAILLLGLIVLRILPDVGSAVEAARRTQCRNNLKQIGAVMHKWHDEFDRFPDAVTSMDDGPPVSWRVGLLDRLHNTQLTDQYETQHSWDSDANLRVARHRLNAYVCPSNIYYSVDEVGRHYSAYALVTGPDSVFPEKRGLSLSEIPSSSSTLMVSESCGLNIVWTEPRDVFVPEQPAGVNLSGKEPLSSSGWLSSYHGDGSHVGLVDGSVQFLSDNIAPEVLRSLLTVDGNDNSNGEW